MKFFAALLAAAAVSSVHATVVPPEDAQALASRVRGIFENKCVECHDERRARPKGHFGYVLDMARVAANTKMIVRGDPGRSELYQLVLDDEMPGKKATVPPLTPEEKGVVKNWILLGAPPAQVVSPPPSAAPSQVQPRLSLVSRCIRAAGQLHPPSAHFPIALIICACPAECMWEITRRRSWKAAARFCVTLGAASAAATAILGWCDAPFMSYTGQSASVLAWHRWMGTGTAVLALIAAIVCEVSHREQHSTRRLERIFQMVLLFTVAAVSVAGFLGGSLIYGLDHFKF